MSSNMELSQQVPVELEEMMSSKEEESVETVPDAPPGEEDEVEEEEEDKEDRSKVENQQSNTTLSCPSAERTSFVEMGKPTKRKKAKGRNGNIYIGVTNRIEWFRLQEKFGFDNVNLFGNFVMNYMEKVHSDFDILHQMTVKTGLFEEQGLSDFRWVNGMPHPVNAANEFISLPVVNLTEEVAEQGFKIAYDLAMDRSQYLIKLAESLNQSSATGLSFTVDKPGTEGSPEDIKTETNENADVDAEDDTNIGENGTGEVKVDLQDEILKPQSESEEVEEAEVSHSLSTEAAVESTSTTDEKDLVKQESMETTENDQPETEEKTDSSDSPPPPPPSTPSVNELIITPPITPETPESSKPKPEEKSGKRKSIRRKSTRRSTKKQKVEGENLKPVDK